LPNGSTGWQLKTVVNDQSGEMAIDLWSDTPVATSAAGSLVTVTLHPLGNAVPQGSSLLTLKSQFSPAAGQSYRTEVSDVLGAFVLHTTAATAYLSSSGPALNATLAPPTAIATSTGQEAVADMQVISVATLPGAKEAGAIAILDQAFAGWESLETR